MEGEKSLGVEVHALRCDCRQATSHHNPTSCFVGGVPTKLNTGLQSRELLTTPFWSFNRSPEGEKLEYHVFCGGNLTPCDTKYF
jgi:hypothetical protein